MKLLEDRILKDGHIGADNVLKVDSFLNHQIDVNFVCELGKEFYRLFKDENITKILTIEASGIGIACLAAQYFGVPVVFAKKTKTINIYSDTYNATVHSYTHKKDYDIVVSKEFLSKEDNVLIIDDSLFERNRSKKVELLAKIYDHAKYKYAFGFRMLTLGWSDGCTFLPINSVLLSTENSKN